MREKERKGGKGRRRERGGERREGKEEKKGERGKERKRRGGGRGKGEEVLILKQATVVKYCETISSNYLSSTSSTSENVIRNL